MKDFPKKKSLMKEWVLSAEAFEILLKSLDEDRGKASAIYEDIRKRLIRQFTANQSLIADEQTDEVFNRVARKIYEEDFILDSENPYPYFHGTARFILLEYQREKRRKLLGLDDLKVSEEPTFDPVEAFELIEEKMRTAHGLEALKHCREKLSESEIALLDKYDLIAGKDKKIIRERLAADFGKTVNALKISINRIRNKLITCAKKKLRIP